MFKWWSIIHGRWDLERGGATAKIAQRQKSGTIRQAAWPVDKKGTKPPPRTPPPPPCQGRPRHIHPAGTVEQDQSTFFFTYLKKNKYSSLSQEDYKKHFHLEHSRPSVKLLPLLIEYQSKILNYQLTILNYQLTIVNHQLSYGSI